MMPTSKSGNGSIVFFSLVSDTVIPLILWIPSLVAIRFCKCNVEPINYKWSKNIDRKTAYVQVVADGVAAQLVNNSPTVSSAIYTWDKK